MDTGERFRAQWAKQLVATAKRYPEPGRNQLLEAMGEDTRGVVRAAGLLDYVEASVFMGLLRAIYFTLGEHDRNDFYTRALALALDTPLLKPLYKGGTGMFGTGPSGVLRMTPFVWKLLTRGCGSVSASKSDPSSMKLLFGVGPHFFNDPPFIAGMAGYMHAALAWANTSGQVTWTVDDAEYAIDYTVDWE